MTPPDAVARLENFARLLRLDGVSLSVSRADSYDADHLDATTFAADIDFLLASLADAERDAALIKRLEQCKGFDVGYHFAARPPVWTVTDTNMDDEEYTASTLRDALVGLADAYPKSVAAQRPDGTEGV